MNDSVKRAKLKNLITGFFIFVFYVVAAKLGLKLAFVNASATAVWAPTGIAFASFLIFGKQFWPSIFAGAFLVNFLTAGSLTTSLVIAGGNTLEGLLGALLVHRFANGLNVFERASDILKFIMVGAISTTVSSTVGVTILCLESYASWGAYYDIWLTWWLGDLTGALLVTPFLILWFDDPRIKTRQLSGILLSFLFVFLTGQAVFAGWFFSIGQDMHLEFLCIPPLIWIAYRFGLRETAAASILLCGVTLWNTIHGGGPFVRPSSNQSLLLIQVFMGVISMTSLALAAAIKERETVEENLERSQKLEENLHEKIELIRLLQSITVAANESVNLEEAVQISLMLVCGYMDWPVGHVYYVDPENEKQLKPGAQWFVHDENKYKNFHRVTDQRVFRSGEGLPGMVLSTGAPQWIEDVTQFDNFPRSKMGLDIKVKAAFGFPVMIGKNVGAVLEFFSDQPAPPNKDLMESMRHVGTQLGRIIERHNAEQSLLNSEKHFRALIENALDIVTVLDPQANFSFLSPSTQIVLGYAPAELIGLNAFIFIHPEDVNSVMERFNALVQDPSQTQFAQFRFKHKNGGWIHLESIGKNLLAEPSVAGIVVNSRDISEKRSAEIELKKQAQLLKSIIDNMGEGLLVCDAQGKTLFVNPAADQMLGGQIGDPLPGEKGQKNEVYKADGETLLLPSEFPVTQAIYGESSDNVELFIKNSQKPGGIYIIATSRPIRDFEGKITGAVSVFRDITEQKRAGEERQRLVTLVEHSRDMIVWSTPEGKNLYINDAGRQMVGIDPDKDMNTIKPESLFSLEEITRLKSLNGLQGEAIRQRGFWEGEMNLLHQKTGKTVPIHFSVVMLNDPKNGKPLGRATIGRDMTERRETEKNLRESDMRFRSVVQSSLSSIIVSDGQGKILSWNAGAEKTFGYSEQEMLDQYFSTIFPAHYREKYKINEEIFQKPHGAALLGKTVEILGLKKSGAEFPIELSLSSWGIGDKTYFGGIIRDITERKKMEELLRSNTELQQFANVASHDLQEPLRMVASYVQLLEEHLKGKLDQDAVEYMGFAVDGARRMQMLVNGLLEYSRVESQAKAPQFVDMNKIFTQTLSDMEIRMAETGAKITHNSLPTVTGDPIQLAQLTQNLLSNALKFQKNGTPEIDFSAKESENEWVFACRDNGIGIDPKYFDRIFVIFQRLHHRDEYSGTGIGLAICKRIVERHGGRIWVESQPNSGATFFFTLPKRND